LELETSGYTKDSYPLALTKCPSPSHPSSFHRINQWFQLPAPHILESRHRRTLGRKFVSCGNIFLCLVCPINFLCRARYTISISWRSFLNRKYLYSLINTPSALFCEDKVWRTMKTPHWSHNECVRCISHKRSWKFVR
jgi:hypothetical protein